MVTGEDLVDDVEFLDIYCEIEKKLDAFGAVSSIVIPRPNPFTLELALNVGKVYVKMADVIPAKKARHRLSGSTFNGRTVIISFYSESLFNANTFM